MKTITNKTILVQGDKTYQPIEANSVIYWVDDSLPKDREVCLTLHKDTKEPMVDKDGFYEEDLSYYKYQPKKIVAQSRVADGWRKSTSPIINLDDFVERLAKNCADLNKSKFSNWYGCHDGFIDGYNSNTNQYTLKDIEEAIKLARPIRDIFHIEEGIASLPLHTNDQILEQINSISTITIDEQFNIISYE